MNAYNVPVIVSGQEMPRFSVLANDERTARTYAEDHFKRAFPTHSVLAFRPVLVAEAVK